MLSFWSYLPKVTSFLTFFFFFFSLKSKNPFGSVIETASLIFAGMTVAILSLLGQSSVEWFYRRSEAFSVSHL